MSALLYRTTANSPLKTAELNTTITFNRISNNVWNHTKVRVLSSKRRGNEKQEEEEKKTCHFKVEPSLSLFRYTPMIYNCAVK